MRKNFKAKRKTSQIAPCIIYITNFGRQFQNHETKKNRNNSNFGRLHNRYGDTLFDWSHRRPHATLDVNTPPVGRHYDGIYIERSAIIAFYRCLYWHVHYGVVWRTSPRYGIGKRPSANRRHLHRRLIDRPRPCAHHRFHSYDWRNGSHHHYQRRDARHYRMAFKESKRVTVGTTNDFLHGSLHLF